MVGIRRALRAALVSAAGFLVLAGSAQALSGKTIRIGTPSGINAMSVAVDTSGTAYVAWNNDVASPNAIQYCVLLAKATSCLHSGTLVLAHGAANADGVQVLVDGSTVVVLADVFYGTTNHAAPEQEWQSTDGGASWGSVQGGLSVANGQLNADSQPVNGVIVPGANELGFAWQTPLAGPTFNAFPLNSPTQCSELTPCSFARLEPSSNPDQVGNGGGVVAAQAGTHPGVMEVQSSLFTTGPLGCTGSFGLAYAYGSGNQSSTNSYNVSPGATDTAWKVPIRQLGCNLEYPAAGGGQSDFGLVAADTASSHEVFRPFHSSTMSWGGQVTFDKQSGTEPSLSQDGAGGLYATYVGSSVNAIRLAFSGDAGTFWGVNTINPGGSVDYLTSNVGESGQGWAAWINGGSVYAQQFDAADAAYAAPATVGHAAKRNGSKLAVSVSCKGPCTVKLKVLTRSHKPKTLARGTVKVNLAGEVITAELRLTGAGKSLLKHHHGRLKENVKFTTDTLGRTFNTKHSLEIGKK